MKYRLYKAMHYSPSASKLNDTSTSNNFEETSRLSRRKSASVKKKSTLKKLHLEGTQY